jgi:superfamily II DNA helicase RecQ
MAIVQAIADELRGVDYKAAGTLQRSLELAGSVSRSDFDGLLDAMARAGLVEIEDAEYEKDGEVRRFRKIRLTEAGREMRASSQVELLISDGVVGEFGGRSVVAQNVRKPKAVAAKNGAARVAEPSAAPVRPTPEIEALAARIKEWRAAEARRLGVPAYVVLHDRTVAALAQARPGNPRQLLAIDGIGPAKVERFGEAILGLCGAAKS